VKWAVKLDETPGVVRRMSDSRVRRVPTTSVLRRIPLFSRSLGVLDQTPAGANEPSADSPHRVRGNPPQDRSRGMKATHRERQPDRQQSRACSACADRDCHMGQFTAGGQGAHMSPSSFGPAPSAVAHLSPPPPRPLLGDTVRDRRT
jgi:hypothetical protein